MQRKVISHLVVMGDSLSDRGTVCKRYLGGVIPMRWILEMDAHTHNGRFTNQNTWDDDFSTMLASGFLAKHFKSEHRGILDDTDIADDVIDGDAAVTEEASYAYSLDNDLVIQFNGADFVRNFCEGGLSAADYSQEFTFDPTIEMSRKILSNIKKQRQKLFADDTSKQVTDEQKSRTMVVEWSGGNDLLTMNAKPSFEAARNAVLARMENLHELIASGYRHFVLCTVPDLTITPRYQNKNAEERIEIQDICKSLNEMLKVGCKRTLDEFQSQYPGLTIDVFEVNDLLKTVYKNPKKFGFDPAKLHLPFSMSEEYKKNNQKAVLPATGYMFWDDIHPSATTHAILAKTFYDDFSGKYEFIAPDLSSTPAKTTAQILYETFIKSYRKEVRKAVKPVAGMPGLFADLSREAPLDTNSLADEGRYIEALATILNHALNGNGMRTNKLLMKLGWLSKDGAVSTNMDALEKAAAMLDNMPKDHHVRII